MEVIKKYREVRDKERRNESRQKQIQNSRDELAKHEYIIQCYQDRNEQENKYQYNDDDIENLIERSQKIDEECYGELIHDISALTINEQCDNRIQQQYVEHKEQDHEQRVDAIMQFMDIKNNEIDES